MNPLARIVSPVLGPPLRFLGERLGPGVRLLFLSNLAVFAAIHLLERLAPRVDARHVVDAWLAINRNYTLPVFFVWELGTYAFVHVSGFHLLFDLAILWVFAPDIERRWGTSRFLRFFLFSAIVGGIAHQAIALGSPWGEDPAVGPTGPLLGLLLVFASYHPDRRVSILFVIPARVRWAIPAMVALAIFLVEGDRWRISQLAHFTGIGAALFYVASYHRTWDFRVWRYLR